MSRRPQIYFRTRHFPLDRHSYQEYCWRSFMTKQKQARHTTLKDWRKSHALTQAEAAKRLAISQPTYSRFEARQRTPHPQAAKVISAKTGIPVLCVLGIG